MKLSSIFSDGAVFQREIPIVVWGDCTPHARVKAKLGGNVAYYASNAAGHFELRLPPMAAGGPYELEVVDEVSKESVTVRDILVGEVWLASGQSNMAFPLNTFSLNGTGSQLQDYLKEGGADDGLRMFYVPRDTLSIPESDCNSRWEKSTADTASEFTAVGAWFALFLRARLGVPVGIIHSSFGGSPVHAWMSREALARREKTRAMLEVCDRGMYGEVWCGLSEDIASLKNLGTTQDFDFSRYTEMDSGNQGLPQGWASPDFDDSDWQDFQVPGSWVEAGINFSGATWARLAVDIPQNWEGRELTLKFGGVDKHDITYFNGVEVGRTGKDFETQYWCEPREYKVPAGLVKAGRALIAVRGFSFMYDGSLNGSPKMFFLACDETGERIELARTWKAKAEYTIKTLVFLHDVDLFPEHSGPGSNHNHHGLFDAMIKPLIPYGIKGVIWYQGENDCKTFLSGDYCTRLADMIYDWRYKWAQGDFPFYMVQLAGYNSGEQWLIIQEQQRRTASMLPNVDMIVASDLGEQMDIHPHDKRSVGLRLAKMALHDTYGVEDVVPCGPVFKSAKPMGSTMLLEFDWAEGLHNSCGDDAEVQGFELGDWQGNFHGAKARIDGSRIVLQSEEVPIPVYVRYNWKPWPDGRVVNCADLPMATFNTYRKVDL